MEGRGCLSLVRLFVCVGRDSDHSHMIHAADETVPPASASLFTRKVCGVSKQVLPLNVPDETGGRNRVNGVGDK